MNDNAETQTLGLLAADLADVELHDRILRSTVRFARLAFASAAASVFLYDPARDSLIFEATSGVGEDRLVGDAIPADRGIISWVFQTGETIVVRDVGEDSRFDDRIAVATGLVPEVILAAPLIHRSQTVGALEVIDPTFVHSELLAIEMLTEFATQATLSLALLVAARRLMAEQLSGAPTAGTRLSAALRSIGDQAAADELMGALTNLLQSRRG